MDKTKIIIWGCGTRGQNLASALDKNVCDIVFCEAKNDTNSICVNEENYDKITPNELGNISYDYIFIGSQAADEKIYKRLQDMGISAKKIVRENIGPEKLGEIKGLFTSLGYAYICNLHERDELELVKKRLDYLDSDWRLMREYELGSMPKSYENKVKRIGVICLDAIPNVTERIISACSRYIISKVVGDKEYNLVNIDYYNPNYEVLSSCDAIVFAGGGIIKLNSLKFDFPRLIDNITIIAERYNIPVLFVGVGVENKVYDEAGYILMQRALNRNCVKYISVRENLKAIKEYVINPNVEVVKAADPALFVKEAYDLKAKEKTDKLIGVGVVNFVNWKREGYPIDKSELLKFYANLFAELEKRGYQWKIFCNGVMGDNTFIQEVCEMDPSYEEHRIARPETDVEWLETMQSFEGIIAPRLHTNIVAYALGIPCVAMVWNQKIKAFANNVKTPSFVPKEFDAVAMVDALEQIKSDDEILQKNKKAIYSAVEQFVVKYVFPVPEPSFWSKVIRKSIRRGNCSKNFGYRDLQ